MYRCTACGAGLQFSNIISALVNPCSRTGRQGVADAGRLGDGLVVVLPAGGHAPAFRMGGQIVIRRVDAVSEHHRVTSRWKAREKCPIVKA